MYNCPICNRASETLRQIAKHIDSKHKLSPKDVLFTAYPELFNDCNQCGTKVKSYKTDKQSRKFCCKECEIEWRKSRKQSPETIAKRIANTDQNKKTEARRQTMLERYDSLYHPFDPESRNQKLSESLSGRPHTKEHHIKVIESKRKNGNIKHTPSTKRKISDSLKQYYNDDTNDHSVTIPAQGKGGRGYSQGEYNGVYYRSSYELKFLQLCEKNHVVVESASTKEFRIRYEYDGKKKYYYPDFYLPEYDVVCEIKPLSMLDYDSNSDKIQAGALAYSFWLVTEEELDDEIFISEVNSFERFFPE